MRIRLEPCIDEEEIVIRCREPDAEANALLAAVTSAVQNFENGRPSAVLCLTKGNTERFLSPGELLFFETGDHRVYAHTRSEIYLSAYKLYELEALLPGFFVRVSKSVIVNIFAVSSLTRELVGNGSISFSGTEKKTYFSRSYYRILRDKIEDLRILQNS